MIPEKNLDDEPTKDSPGLNKIAQEEHEMP